MQYYGYERVSTKKQEFDRQKEALEAWSKENNVKFKKVYSDKVSGRTFARESYQNMKESLEKGDCVVIKEIDRLGRDWDGIKEEWTWMLDNDINVIIIDFPILNNFREETVTLDKKLLKTLILEILCYVSQKETENISRKTKEALAAKKAAGVKLGRPIKEKECEKIVKFYEQGMDIMSISKKVEVSRGTVYSALKRKGYDIRKKRN